MSLVVVVVGEPNRLTDVTGLRPGGELTEGELVANLSESDLGSRSEIQCHRRFVYRPARASMRTLPTEADLRIT